MPDISTQLVNKLASIAASLDAVLKAIGGAEIEVTPEIAAARDQLIAAGVCLRCLKKKEGRYTRGDCASCYNQTIKEINRNEITLEEVVSMGRLTPEAKRGGRKRDKDRPAASELGDITKAAAGILSESAISSMETVIESRKKRKNK